MAWPATGTHPGTSALQDGKMSKMAWLAKMHSDLGPVQGKRARM